jgi:hypothetical protein
MMRSGFRLAKAPAISCVLLVVTVILLNLEVLSLGFLADDYVLLDNVIHYGINFAGDWLENSALYRPIITLSMWLNLEFFGSNPQGYHLFNLLVHVTNVLILFALIRFIFSALGQEPPLPQWRLSFYSFLFVLVFVLHPANVHDVAWIRGRTDLLCALFFLISLALFLRFEQNNKKSLRILSVLSFILALGSKETAIILPLILIVVSFHIALCRKNYSLDHHDLMSLGKALSKRTLVYFLVAFSYLLFRALIFQKSAEHLNWSTAGIQELVLLLAKSAYLFFSPLDPLSSFYLFMNSPFVAVPVILFMAFVACLFYFSLRSRVPVLVAGFLVLSTMLLSISPYIYLGSVSQRLMYIPIGCMILQLVPMIGLIRLSLKKEIKRRIAVAVAFPVVLCIYFSFYRDNIYAWMKGSMLADRVVKETVDQLDDPQKPIAILTYPHRVNQAYILWDLPYVLHFGIYGTFGRCKSVRSGVVIVGSDFSTIGSDIYQSRTSSLNYSFLIESRNPHQFLFLDPEGMSLPRGDIVWDTEPGEVLDNSLVSAKILETNSARRAIRLQVTILDSTFYSHAQVFVFEDRHMKRIQ